MEIRDIMQNNEFHENHYILFEKCLEGIRRN